MDLNEVVGIDYYSLFSIVGIAFMLGFMLGKKVARMGFMFMLLIAVGAYFIYASQTGEEGPSGSFEIPQSNGGF